jgi:hypothetical protein
MPKMSDERKYPVDPNLNFDNTVVPVEELTGDDYLAVMKDCPLITSHADDYEWYAVIDRDQSCIAHMICVPKQWIPEND